MNLRFDTLSGRSIELNKIYLSFLYPHCMYEILKKHCTQRVIGIISSIALLFIAFAGPSAVFAAGSPLIPIVSLSSLTQQVHATTVTGSVVLATDSSATVGGIRVELLLARIKTASSLDIVDERFLNNIYTLPEHGSAKVDFSIDYPSNLVSGDYFLEARAFSLSGLQLASSKISSLAIKGTGHRLEIASNDSSLTLDGVLSGPVITKTTIKPSQKLIAAIKVFNPSNVLIKAQSETKIYSRSEAAAGDPEKTINGKEISFAAHAYTTVNIELPLTGLMGGKHQATIILKESGGEVVSGQAIFAWDQLGAAGSIMDIEGQTSNSSFSNKLNVGVVTSGANGKDPLSQAVLKVTITYQTPTGFSHSQLVEKTIPTLGAPSRIDLPFSISPFFGSPSQVQVVADLFTKEGTLLHHTQSTLVPHFVTPPGITWLRGIAVVILGLLLLLILIRWSRRNNLKSRVIAIAGIFFVLFSSLSFIAVPGNSLKAMDISFDCPPPSPSSPSFRSACYQQQSHSSYSTDPVVFSFTGSDNASKSGPDTINFTSDSDSRAINVSANYLHGDGTIISIDGSSSSINGTTLDGRNNQGSGVIVSKSVLIGVGNPQVVFTIKPDSNATQVTSTQITLTANTQNQSSPFYSDGSGPCDSCTTATASDPISITFNNNTCDNSLWRYQSYIINSDGNQVGANQIVYSTTNTSYNNITLNGNNNPLTTLTMAAQYGTVGSSSWKKVRGFFTWNSVNNDPGFIQPETINGFSPSTQALSYPPGSGSFNMSNTFSLSPSGTPSNFVAHMTTNITAFVDDRYMSNCTNGTYNTYFNVNVSPVSSGGPTVTANLIASPNAGQGSNFSPTLSASIVPASTTATQPFTFNFYCDANAAVSRTDTNISSNADSYTCPAGTYPNVSSDTPYTAKVIITGSGVTSAPALAGLTDKATTVPPPPSIKTFVATPSTVTSGGLVSFTWSTGGGVSKVGLYDNNGNLIKTAANTDPGCSSGCPLSDNPTTGASASTVIYTLKALDANNNVVVGPNGQVALGSNQVTVNPPAIPNPAIYAFTVNGSNTPAVTSGMPINFSWTVGNSSSITITEIDKIGGNPVPGGYSLTSPVSSTGTVTCSGNAGPNDICGTTNAPTTGTTIHKYYQLSAANSGPSSAGTSIDVTVNSSPLKVNFSATPAAAKGPFYSVLGVDWRSASGGVAPYTYVFSCDTPSPGQAGQVLTAKYFNSVQCYYNNGPTTTTYHPSVLMTDSATPPHQATFPVPPANLTYAADGGNPGVPQATFSETVSGVSANAGAPNQSITEPSGTPLNFTWTTLAAASVTVSKTVNGSTTNLSGLANCNSNCVSPPEAPTANTVYTLTLTPASGAPLVRTIAVTIGSATPNPNPNPNPIPGPVGGSNLFCNQD